MMMIILYKNLIMITLYHNNIFCRNLKLVVKKFQVCEPMSMYTRAFLLPKWCWVNRNGSRIRISLVKHHTIVSLSVVLGCCRSWNSLHRRRYPYHL